MQACGLLRRAAWLIRSAALIVALSPIVVFAAPPLITYEKVLEYLQLDVSQDKILKLLEDSPTTFVLSGDQVNSLREAGAGPQIIAAMQKQGQAVEAGSDVSDFVVILDCSGSMNDKLPDGGSKWLAARQAATNLIGSIPDGRNLSLIVYGCDVERQCKSVDIVRPLSPLDGEGKATLIGLITNLKAIGHTPISRSLQMAGLELDKAEGMSSVILITDGMETCHMDPAAEAAKLVERFPNLRGGVTVVGFCLSQKESKQVAEIARAGKGEYYDAQNASQLVDNIRQIQKKIVKADVIGETDLESLSPIDRLLIEQLSDESQTVRESAAQTVKERKLTAAVPALSKLIIDGVWGTGIWADGDRNEALKALITLGPDRVALVLAETLNSESYSVRCWSAKAILNCEVAGAVGAVEERLVSMQNDDISLTLINGTDEADNLFAALKKLNPDRLEAVLMKMLKSTSPNKKAWAAGKIKELK